MPNNTQPDSGDFLISTKKFLDKNAQAIRQDYNVSYERIASSHPSSPEYQVKISATTGVVVEYIWEGVAQFSYGTLFRSVTKALGAILPNQTAKRIEFVTKPINEAVYKMIDIKGDEVGASFGELTADIFDYSSGNNNQNENSNISNRTRQETIINSTSDSGENKSITATKTTNPKGTSSISVNSDDYSKDDLLSSSKNLAKDNIGSNLTIEGSDGTINGTVINQELLKDANKILKNDLTLDSPLITKIDDNNYGLLEKNTILTLKDGTTSTLDTIISSLQTSFQAIPKFLFSAADFGPDLLNAMTSIFSNEHPLIRDDSGNQIYLDADGYQTTNAIDPVTGQPNEEAKGASPLERIEAEFIARIIEGESAQDIAIDIAEREFARNISNDLANKIGGSNVAQAGMALIIMKVGLAAIQGDGLNGNDYAMIAAEGILVAFGVSPAAAQIIVSAVDKIIQEDGRLNANEYQDVAAAAATAVVVITVCEMVGSFVGSFFGPAGTVVGFIVGALVGYVIAAPVYNSIRNSWEDFEQIYDAFEDMFKGDNIGEQLKEALKGYEDFQRTITVDFVKDIAIGVYNLFGGHYGKTLGAGEYWNPYSFINVTPKEDGTGSIITGVEREGAVLIASENGNDDIYGTNGQDIMIGKSGKNTILGYDGNDHIEGRSNDDILIGGQGDDEILGGLGNDYLSGSEGDDSLFGGAGDDIILGGEGNDYIEGGDGNDQIEGGAGSDYIDGGVGNDTIVGGAGNDIIEGQDGDDSILGEDGDDIILAGDGNDIVDGGTGDDVIEGGAGNDNLAGNDGDDTINGGAGIDIIFGDVGSDIINSGHDDDLVFGGIGNDIIYGSNGNDSLYGEIGNDYVIGGEGDDIIDGGAGDDVLMGGKGNDTIATGEGNDTIIFLQGYGQDTIDDTDAAGSDVIRLADTNSNQIVLGKVDNDLVIQFKNPNYNSSLAISETNQQFTTDKITIKNEFNLDGTTNSAIDRIEFADGKKIELTTNNLQQLINNPSQPLTTDHLQLTTYSNIDTAIQTELALGYQENFSTEEEAGNNQTENPNSSFYDHNYETSANQDQIDNEKFNEVQWRSHKEKRSAFGGHYTVWTKYYERNLNGTNGNDRIVGNWWAENINGGAGDDQLSGNDGNDTIRGGTGNDLISGGTGEDSLYGEAGNDKIYGGTGNDYIDGGADNDDLIGNEGDDTMLGGDGDDRLSGNGGNDNLNLGTGNNIAYGGAGIDTITSASANGKNFIDGGDDNDIINAGSNDDYITGSSGNDSINGGDGNNQIYGNDGSDNITSGIGDDYISGGSGDDIINAGNGNNTVYGNLGNDQITAGTGIDYIYGGAGADIVKAGAGNDVIYGNSDQDWIEGEAGNDSIYGGTGSDNLFGGDGNDIINGNEDGDVIYGGKGNDQLYGGQGNDILIDDQGSDQLDGGADKDIIILTKEDGASTSVDTINNFNKDEDKIILKVNYKTPINFTILQASMQQNGANTEINLDNGQKIIITNTNKADLNEHNFAIGLSTGTSSAANQILFGTEGDDTLFGDQTDNTIYGGAGNDELWGGLGSDALYGQDGNDILRYEADGVYVGTRSLYGGYNEKVIYWGYSHNYTHPDHYYRSDGSQSNGGWWIDPNPYVNYTNVYNANWENNVDVAINSDILSRVQIASHYIISPGNHGSFFGYVKKRDDIRGVYSVTKIEYQDTVSDYFSTKNFYNSQLTDITGYNRSFDRFIGGAGQNVILMTEGNDVLTAEDPTSAGAVVGQSRVQNISTIYAGAGNDVLNFTSPKFTFGDMTFYGGDGNDKIWSNAGNDKIFGGDGNDEIYSGKGNDTIDGGSGDDVIYGGDGNDVILGGEGNNKIYGEAGDDIIFAGTGADVINGGDGNDTISYVNSSSAVKVNIGNITFYGVAGGSAGASTITNVENIIGSSFDDILIGSYANNILSGSLGNDLLKGSLGDDTYVFNKGDGSDTIADVEYPITTPSSGNDKILLNGYTEDQVILKIGANINDLEITFKDNSQDKITILWQLNQTSTSQKIETLEFSNGRSFNLSNLYLINEDTVARIANSKVNPSSTAIVSSSHGFLAVGDSGNINYLPSANFSGLDQVTYQEKNSSGVVLYTKTYSIFIAAQNDAPTTTVIANQEINPEQQFSVNLSQYFADADNDNLQYTVKLNGNETLPNGISFNQTTKTISGVSATIQNLHFEVMVSDNKGGAVNNSFNINVVAPTTSGTNIANNLLASFAAPNPANTHQPVLSAEVINQISHTTYIQNEGSNFSENITADQPTANNFVDAGAGNDNIKTFAGNDIINAGTGNDKISSGTGNDIITGGTGSDTFVISTGNTNGETTITDFEFNNSAETIDISSFIGIRNLSDLTITAGSAIIHLPNGQTIHILNATPENISASNFQFAANQAPTANNINSATNEDHSVNIDVLATAADIEGDSLSINSINQPTHGTAQIITNPQTGHQTISYMPNANYNGTDSFAYTISDGNGGTAQRTVSVAIASANDAPLFINNYNYTEELVNSYTANGQHLASITNLVDGGWVVAWHSYYNDDSYYDIYLQRYDVNGHKVGTETRVNTTTVDHQFDPSVNALPDGGWLVSWTSYGQDGSGWGVYAQRYDQSGVAVGNEFAVNSYTSASQYGSAISATNDGGFIVAWASDKQDDSYEAVYFQRYDLDGNKDGGETQVNTYTFRAQLNPAITTLQDGSFIIVWQSDIEDGSGYGVYLQHYSSEGIKIGDETQVNIFTNSDQSNPTIASLADGGFIIAWDSGNLDDVYFQRYSANGTKIGDETRANTNAAYGQFKPQIAGLKNGEWVISWTSYAQDDSGWGIYSQHYDQFGNKIGGETLVNSFTVKSQYNSTITALNDGGWVIAWESDGQDGSAEGIYQQRFAADGSKVGSTGSNITKELTVIEDTSSNPVLIAATDPDNDVLNYSLKDNHHPQKGEVIFDQQQGTYTYIPHSNQNGNDNFVIIINDGNGGNAELNVNVKITAVNDAPIVNSIINDQFINNNNFTFTIPADSFIDIDGDTLTYSLKLNDGGTISDLPSWLSFNSTTRTLSGMVPGKAPGAIQLLVIASDGSLEANQTFTLNIQTTQSQEIQNTITGTNSKDTLTGTNLNDQISGGANADILYGGLGNDTLLGGSSDDILIGGEGSDILDGGTAIDTASYNDSDASIIINLELNTNINNPNFHTAQGGTAEGDILINIENITGSNFNDNLTGN
ncbi:MAG: tandem-95 repeat protein, partial [Pseudomonadota bacterium]